MPPGAKKPVKKLQSKKSHGANLESTSWLYQHAYRIIHSHWYEHVNALVILINFVLIIIETDSSEKLVWIDVVGWFILMLFICEISLRYFVKRSAFWHEFWNTFDFAVVVTDVFLSGIGVVFGSNHKFAFLRVVRLCRLAQVSKMFRVFHELRLMMAGLLGAMRAIFWGTLLLFSVLLIWSVIAVQYIHPLNEEVAKMGYYKQCGRCHKAYATTMAATLTFAQQIVAGDSWGRETVPVIENYPLTALFFAGVFLTVGLAVLNLILGVVVSVAQDARDRLKVDLENEALLEMLDSQSDLVKICAEMDSDDSGQLTKDEIFTGYADNSTFRDTLTELGCEEEDLEIVWTILDSDRSGTVSSTEFVTQIYKMRGSDSQFMLAYIKFYITIIRLQLSQDMQLLKEGLKGDMLQHFGKPIQGSSGTGSDALDVPNSGVEGKSSLEEAADRVDADQVLDSAMVSDVPPTVKNDKEFLALSLTSALRYQMDSKSSESDAAKMDRMDKDLVALASARRDLSAAVRESPLNSGRSARKESTSSAVLESELHETQSRTVAEVDSGSRMQVTHSSTVRRSKDSMDSARFADVIDSMQKFQIEMLASMKEIAQKLDTRDSEGPTSWHGSARSGLPTSRSWEIPKTARCPIPPQSIQGRESTAGTNLNCMDPQGMDCGLPCRRV
jgi:voltage-gated sodium channel